MSNMPRFNLFSFAKRLTNPQDDLGPREIISLIGPYVDSDYYLNSNPDVSAANADPVDHYLRHGWREGRNPSVQFDTNFYMRLHMSPKGEAYCPLIHYAREGMVRGLATNSGDFQSALSESHKDSVIELIDGLFDVPILRHPVFENDENRRVLLWMFSPSCYRTQKATANISDNEALARYLAFDLEGGMAPGPLFVNDHYIQMAQAKGFHLSSKAPFLHWLEHGLPNRISPNPIYSDETYLELNPDLVSPHPWAGWPFLHLLQYGLSEGRRITKHLYLSSYVTHALKEDSQLLLLEFLATCSTRPDIYREIEKIDQFRTSPLFDELVKSALDIDPAIGPLHKDMSSIIPPLYDGSYRDFQEILGLIPEGSYDSIIFMPFCKMGGADFIAGCLAHAISETDRVLILRTDQSEWSCPHWFPEDITTIDLSRHLGLLEDRTRTRVLYELVRKLAVRNVFNLNSRICFETYVRYGSRISLFANTYAYYFCSDRTEDGIEVGYPVWYFGQIIDHLKGAFVDNASLAQTLVKRFLLPETVSSKVKVAYTPMMGSVRRELAAEKQVESSASRKSPVLLWAGRFDRQKRFDLVVDIAKQLPDVTFRCWGKAVLDAPPDLSRLPDNVEILPPFKSHDELPLYESDGWLYTSEWDGLPTVLIECGGLGLPIVASDVGGVGELIDEDTGWPVRDANSVNAYVAAIKDMLAKPEERVRRARNLKEIVLRRHTMDVYKAMIKDVVEIEKTSGAVN